MMNEQLGTGERMDDLHRRGYRIIQKPGMFCFGMDAVLLAEFAGIRKGERVLDLCTGNGIIPILMQARWPEADYFGLEIQQEAADLARRSVLLNRLEDSIHIACGDIREAAAFYPAGSMDVVTVNPPYMSAGDALQNQSDALTIARHEVLCTLEDVMKAACSMVKVRGRFYMVHRPRRLPEILETMRAHRLEPKKLRFVHPYVGKEANLVLIEGVKDGGEQLNILPPLIVYDAPGQYTQEIYRIYYGE